MSKAILEVGNFGVHVTKSPAGNYIFVGTVPNDLAGVSDKSEAVVVDAFVKWFKSQSNDFKRKHIGDVRNDVFAKLFE